MTIDAGRLRRAVHLAVQIVARGEWLVVGGRQPHTVREVDGVMRCDCRDAELRGGAPCKHRLAVVLLRLPDEVREGLRALVPHYKAEAKARQGQRHDIMPEMAGSSPRPGPAREAAARRNCHTPAL